MTKVQLRYDLLRPLNNELLDQVARVHSVYGIIRVVVPPEADHLTVEYDASRLSALDVENVLQRAGFPIVMHA
jgi:hypothetical protein